MDDHIATTYTDGPWGRMRSRAVGCPNAGAPQVVVVMGMAVADYLIPAVTALGTWTRAHLVELPGLAGSGEPPRPMTVADYADAVAGWLDTAGPDRPVLAGHSSGTQVAAAVAARRPVRVRGLVLASPTIDPAARSWIRLGLRWFLDGRREPPGLTPSHLPEWRRAGPRRLVQLINAHLHDRLEDSVRTAPVPTLLLRGVEDRILTERWARRLVAEAWCAELVQLPGAHTFPWLEPAAWSEPIRRFSVQLP